MDQSSRQRIIPVRIEDQMKSAYIDYSMSVIVSRALPDVRDGLKPVHRRILYGMHELGVTYNKSYKKSARIVGEVLGKYHPHGDTAVYDTMVRMAQYWSLRYPLVDGQGNFGSMDGDSPAAMRYTEARMNRIADDFLGDIAKDTVDFDLNFDDTLKEPTVLPARVPNLLVNGASGIAVGMATNMLPHNLTEVVDGVIACLENGEITMDELCQIIKAPDFPTGGIIYGMKGVREALETGRGRVVVRAKVRIETAANGKETIIVDEIPYQVNKANLIVKIADLVNSKRVDGITDIRDESDRNGLRIVIEVRRDAMANVILSQLYKYTPLQSSYGVNNVALVNGRPLTLNVKDMIEEFIKFRYEVVVRRTKFELNKARRRAHILVGLLVALDYIDKVITLIRASKTPEEARIGLMEGKFIEDLDGFWSKFSELIETRTEEQVLTEGNVLTLDQAKAILDMRLQKLTGLERDKIKAEFDELMLEISRLEDILNSKELQRNLIKGELEVIKEQYGDDRRTEINYSDGDISLEDMIPQEDVVVTISSLGYVKRTAVSEYRTQSRGGRGAMGAKTRDADFVEHMIVANTHSYMMLFTEKGKCFWLKVYEIPEATKTSSGRVIQNILSIPKDDKVKAYILVDNLSEEEYINNHYILFATKKGLVKKTILEAYSRPRVGGINAISINEDDQLLEAILTTGNSEVIIANKSGNAIRFNEAAVRSMGRTATGVRGIRLAENSNDEVIGMISFDAEDTETAVMVVSEKGNGKRTAFADYRLTNRGGKGVRNMMVTDKTGPVVSIKAVLESDDLMITTRSGVTIRSKVSEIRIMGRSTQGVRIIRLDQSDSIADVAVIAEDTESDQNAEENEQNENDQNTNDETNNE